VVPAGSIKRHVTGKGNADKSAVIAAIRARGFSPAQDACARTQSAGPGALHHAGH
jgi:hypothetical protein